MSAVDALETVAPPDNPWLRRLKKLTANKAGLAGIAIIVLLIGVAIFANVLAPYSYKEQKLAEMNLAPSRTHHSY